MAISLRNVVRLGGSYEFGSHARESCSFRPLTNALSDETKNIALKRQIQSTEWRLNCNSNGSASNHVENQGKTTQITRWWEVIGTDNFREILSEEDLKDSLKNAGNKLVVVHFYSPACGGCRPLHPKIYQIAEEHQEVIFLKVNQQEHKSLFKTLIVQIHKLRVALHKHCNEQRSLAKELEDGALLKVDSNKEITFNHPVGSSANCDDFNLLLMLLTKSNI